MTSKRKCGRHSDSSGAALKAMRQRQRKPTTLKLDAREFEEDQTCAYDGSQSAFTHSFPTTPCRPFLKELDGLESHEGQKSNLAKLTRRHRCKFLSLFEQETSSYKRFKAFEEREVPFASSAVTIVELDDPAKDDDCQTDKEQIAASLTSLNSSIHTAFRLYSQGKCPIMNFEKGRKRLPSPCPLV